MIVSAAEEAFEKEKTLPSVHGSSEYKRACTSDCNPRLHNESHQENRSRNFLAETITLKINGREETARVRPYDTLSRVLREELGFTGTKRGCDYGGCGACTVSLDGKAVYSCMYPAQYAEGKEIVTVEGLASRNSEGGSVLSKIQESFLINGGLQCGYCTAGIMISDCLPSGQDSQPICDRGAGSSRGKHLSLYGLWAHPRIHFCRRKEYEKIREKIALINLKC